MEARGVLPVACKCHYKCTEIISEEDRIATNREYWMVADYSKQQLLLKNLINIVPCKRTLANKSSRRAQTFNYHIKGKKVCQTFFLKTLHLSRSAIEAFARKNKSGVTEDQRGKHGRQRTMNQELIDAIKAHIESFPVVESHYARAKTRRLYLPSDLNITKMAHLFREKQPDLIVKDSLYRRVFNNNYNFGFHMPKKDACATCHAYNNSLKSDTDQKRQEEHLQNKKAARESKETDKMIALGNPQVKVYTFDLQSVLTTPCGNVSNLYYSRKFASYNSTFYDLATKDGFCYFWHETDGERGSDEIGTAILRQVERLSGQAKEIIFYCDCCGGQNRNKFIGALLLFINNNFNFDKVSIKYLESGHTQMEVDSMHSSIEQAKKNVSVYSPDEWMTIIRNSRRRQPYTVYKQTFGDVKDLKHLFKSLKHPLKKNSNNDQVNWLKIKTLQVRKSDLNSIFYTESWASPMLEINVKDGKRKVNSEPIPTNIVNKFAANLPISVAKYKDLKSLCTKNIIPSEYHQFYLGLKQGVETRNCLDEPNIDEMIE